MSWFEKLMTRFGYTPIAEKQSGDRPRSHAAIMPLGRSVAYPDHQASIETAQQFAWRHPYYFACINAIATAGMGVPLRVVRMVPDPEAQKFVTSQQARHIQRKYHQVDRGRREKWLQAKGLVEEEVLSSHPLVELLDQVSPTTTWGELMYQTLFDLESSGNVYWELVGGAGGAQPSEIVRLRPERMFVKPGKDTRVGGYQLRVNGKEIDFEPDEIIHFRFPHPMDDYYGLSRSETLKAVLNTDWARYQYAQTFFENGATLSYILMPDEGVEMNAEEWERLQEQFAEKYVGAANAHKVGRLQGGNLQEIGHVPRDAEYLGMADRHDMEISSVTGVPTPKFKAKDVNRANYEAAQLQFWSETMTPELTFIAGMINEFLAPRYGPDVVADFDLSTVDVLGDQEDAVIERATKQFEAGAITVNEYRQACGQEPWPEGGDVVKRRLMDKYEEPGAPQESPRPAPTPPAPPPPPPAAEDETEGEDDDEGEQERGQTVAVMKRLEFGSAEHRKAYDAWDRRLRPHEAALRADVVEWAETLRDDVMAKFELEKALKATIPDPTALFEIDAAGAVLWRIVEGHALEAAIAEGARTLLTVGAEGLTFDPENPRVLAYLDAKQLKVKTVAADLHEELRTIVTEGVREGAPIREIADAVSDRFDGLADWQADRIAQTETVGAMNTGSMAAIEQTGMGKEWIATLDDRVRDTHVMAMEDGVLPTDGVFSNGLLHPGDPNGAPEEVINCRCALAPTTLDK